MIEFTYWSCRSHQVPVLAATLIVYMLQTRKWLSEADGEPVAVLLPVLRQGWILLTTASLGWTYVSSLRGFA